MTRAAPASVVGVIAVSAIVACSGGPDGPGAPPAAPESDAGTADAEPVAPAGTIVVRTSTPATTVSPGGRASATWAAYRGDAGGWSLLTAKGVGEYTFSSASSRWAVALACADGKSSLVAIYERPSSVTTLDVVLEEQCGDPPAPSYVLQGTFAHVPPTTGWFDFAYPLDARGALLITSGDSATYEIVNVVDGTWNLAFGVRDDAGAALSKIALLRGRSLTSDTTIDVDLDGAGFAPGAKNLAVAGALPADETLAASIPYTMGGLDGIDLGPQDVPTATTVELTYATVPPDVQDAGDRYRPFVVASGPDSVTERGVRAELHDAIDLAFELPPPMTAPVVNVVATAPYLRLTTRLATRPAAASYEIVSAVRITAQSRRSWRVSVDASLATGTELDVELPDLSEANGFDPTWALPADLGRKTTVTAYERPAPLGDGTLERFAAHTTTTSP